MKIFIAGLLSPALYVGSVWYKMQFAVGLKRLGHDVSWIEEVPPAATQGSTMQESEEKQNPRRERFKNVLERFDLSENACQIFKQGKETAGLSMKALLQIAPEADLLINMAGHLKMESVLKAFKRRIYIDLDPVYTQLWISEYQADLRFDLYHVFFTRGLNIGTEMCAIPTGNISWHPLLPAVILDYWPNHNPNPNCETFTTVASWSALSELEFQGEWYRSKYVQFRNFVDLPERSGQRFEIVIKAWRPEDSGIRDLQQKGWIILPGTELSDLKSYQRFIADSRAEFGIAKEAFTKSRSGWFSERSSHYLANGKPVLAHSTGFERQLPVGEGIIPFHTLEDALVAIQTINDDYEKHSRAARQFAENYLDYRKVLPPFLELCF